jgi:hypothetical protein
VDLCGCVTRRCRELVEGRLYEELVCSKILIAGGKLGSWPDKNVKLLEGRL